MEMRAQLGAVKSAMEEQRRNGPDRDEAAILGAHLEGPFLNPGRHGALDPRMFLEARDYHLESITDGFEDIIRIITVSPELDGALRLIRLCADKGITVSMGHSEATFAEAEAGFHHGQRASHTS
jgi:N-acetylglucosamine-6-phosphate deacetylase